MARQPVPRSRDFFSFGDHRLTSPNDVDASVAAAIAAAVAAMDHAYAPYSNFPVGAALVCADGSIAAGCNVENASYPAGICAERAALSAAVSNGHRHFRLLVVTSTADEPAPPCGLCRQMLVEFAPGLDVVSVTRGGARARWTLSELLAHPFTPASLAHA